MEFNLKMDYLTIATNIKLVYCSYWKSAIIRNILLVVSGPALVSLEDSLTFVLSAAHPQLVAHTVRL